MYSLSGVPLPRDLSTLLLKTRLFHVVEQLNRRLKRIFTKLLPLTEVPEASQLPPWTKHHLLLHARAIAMLAFVNYLHDHQFHVVHQRTNPAPLLRFSFWKMLAS